MSDAFFHRIISQYARALGRVAAVYASGEQEQEDLLQEIYLALWRALPTFRGEASELTFVLSVAHNRGISFASRAQRKRFAELRPDVPDPGSSIDAAAERDERSTLLYAAIRRLAPAQRQAIMLQLEGLSGKEIAAVQGTTENNVNVRLNRARNALRQMLSALVPGT
jgi:RNA polymerase sigma-70 factor (ECF subfamily)